MAFHITPQKFIRYQRNGLVITTTLLVLLVAGFYLGRTYFDSRKRLDALESEVVSQQRTLLRREMDTTVEYVRYMSRRSEEVLKARIRSQVNQAYAVAQSLYEREHARHSADDVKVMIREALRKVRFFNGRGYIFIDDMSGRCVLLPTAPQLEGTSLFNNRDDRGHFIMRGLIDAVSNADQSGFSHYRWYAPDDTNQMRDKIAYVRLFKPFNWIIGTGDYVYQTENDLQKQAIQRLAARRFGDGGYFSILTDDLQVLLSPATPEDAGRSINKLDPVHAQTLRYLLAKATDKGAFVEYDWPRLGETKHEHKLSLVQRIPEWGWVLVAGVYKSSVTELVGKQREALERELKHNLLVMVPVLLFAIAIAQLVALALSRWLSRLFHKYQSNIESQKDELRAFNERLKIAGHVFENSLEGMLVTDSQCRIISVNPAFTQITGYHLSDVQGRTPAILSSGRMSDAFFQSMWAQLKEEGRWSGEIWNRRKCGEVYPEWLSITTVYGAEDELLNYVATFTDITQRKQSEERLQWLADYDPLTELPNRRLLRDRVELALAAAQRRGTGMALMFVDLDRFKTINDSLGHEMGDELLRTIARRLKGAARDVDTVSRIGGDEFVVLVSECSSMVDLSQLAHRLGHTISEPIQLQHHDLIVTASIGIAMSPDDGHDYVTLSRNADTALYHAKEKGRNNYQFFAPELNRRATERLELESRLRHAVERDELRVFYQPQFRLSNGELTGFEALVRWQHPEQGLLGPDRFIPLAEETGLILGIGDWVLEEACQQLQVWNRGRERPLTMAVNLSAVQFRDGLLANIERVIQRVGLAPELLVLEVTESVLMVDQNQAAQLLSQLRMLGVRIALDDFGTGYASLAYLKRLPIDKLKIDKTFTDGVPTDSDDTAIARVIIDIARHLRLETVAEGIETEEQREFMHQSGCHEGQGYLYARPLAANVIEAEVLSVDVERESVDSAG